MNTLSDWTKIVFESLLELGRSIMSALPNILGALFLIILGWFLAKLLSFLVKRGLKIIGFDKIIEKVQLERMFDKVKITILPSQLVARFVYWVILLIFFLTASDTLGWAVVSESISDLIAYLPKLFSGIIIFIIGLYIANFIKRALKGVFDSLNVTSGGFISNFAFYIILIIISLTAIKQAGVDTNIITSNISIILGGILLAFAISFGIGSRTVLFNILSAFYTRNKFKSGQTIEIEDITGTIELIDNTSCIIKTKDYRMVIPVSKLLTENVKIIK